MATLGEMIRRAREERGLTLLQLALKLNVAQSTVSRLEADDYAGPPKPELLAALSDELGLSEVEMLVAVGYRIADELAKIAATEPIKPDDPRTEFIGLVKRVRWTPERVAMMRSILTGMAEYDRKERGG